MTVATKTTSVAKKSALEIAQALAIETRQTAKRAAMDLARLRHAAEKARIAAERAADTRRKVLLGAYVMAQAQSQGWSIAGLDLGAGTLDAYLTRDDDRALFDMPLIPTQPAPEAALPATDY